MSNSTNFTENIPSVDNSKFNPGDIAWVLASTGLVWLMIPGLGFFYSGMARCKNALSLIMLSFLAVPVVSIQNAFFINVLLDVGPTPTTSRVPELVFAIFQGMFAAITPAIAIGSAAERTRLIPTLIFIFIWSTLVYDFIASWCWSANGWYSQLGGLDFAGGTPVHITSGSAALAFCIFLGKRQNHGIDEFKPHNITYVVLGTTFLWFGWFGFNGGSATAANIRAILACTVTNLAASFGGLTWMIMDYRMEYKLSAIGFCSGAVAGLVAITPGSGYVAPHYAVVFGICGGAICNLAVKLKHIFDYDDALDVFAVHGIGGLVGNILTGVFADKNIAALSGEVIMGGVINQNYIQLAKQLSSSGAGFMYSFIMTYIILLVLNKIPFLSIRLHHDKEVLGTDESDHGESAYYFVERVEKALNNIFLKPIPQQPLPQEANIHLY
ncbi:16212_t:CDS:2 [Gigaspora margarita]|uniref:Ammonium transporter n=1 Tax=Gigaspora margarita TaxID=4874 RepID=A0ABN7V5J7_GIGMA|nr:16212_t:CDS:2 [Gigaspora margarita]